MILCPQNCPSIQVLELNSTSPCRGPALNFHVSAVGAESSEISSNWGTVSLKPVFFSDTIHHIHSPLQHDNIPGKTALAILYIFCMMTGISV